MNVMIDKAIPIPDFLVTNYPWDDLEVGDSFLLRAMHNDAMKLFMDAGRKRPSKTFHIQKMEKGIYRVWLINVVNALSDTPLEQLRQVFMSGVHACMKCGVTPTVKLIINRRPMLKRLSSGQWDDIVKILVERGDLTAYDTGKTISYRSTMPLYSPADYKPCRLSAKSPLTQRMREFEKSQRVLAELSDSKHFPLF